MSTCDDRKHSAVYFAIEYVMLIRISGIEPLSDVSCDAVLHSPYLDEVATSFVEQIQKCVQNTYGYVNLMVMYSTLWCHGVQGFLTNKEVLSFIKIFSATILMVGTWARLFSTLKCEFDMSVLQVCRLKASRPRRGQPSKQNKTTTKTICWVLPSCHYPTSLWETAKNIYSQLTFLLILMTTCIHPLSWNISDRFLLSVKVYCWVLSIGTCARSKPHVNVLEAVHTIWSSLAAPDLCAQKKVILHLSPHTRPPHYSLKSSFFRIFGPEPSSGWNSEERRFLTEDRCGE